jgi:hypothetical protein
MARTAPQGIEAWRRDDGILDYEDDDEDWPDDGFDTLWDDDWEPPPPGGWPCHA